MSAFRVRYGLAYGPEGTVSTTSGKFVLTPCDSTPDISLSPLWITNNTSATAISHFDGTRQGGFPGPEEGQVITIIAKDGNTGINNSGQIYRSASGGNMITNEVVTFIYHNSAWYEMSRAVNSQSSNLVLTAQSGILAPEVTGVKNLFITASGVSSVKAFSGGVMGQELTLFVTTVGVAVSVIQGGNILLTGTETLVFSTSGAYQFIKRDATSWSMLSGPRAV